MSWQSYIDRLLETKNIEKAAIFSIAGDSVWASTPSFQVGPEEMKTLVAILSENADAVNKAHAEGVYVNGERYVVARILDRTIYGRQGRTGICVVKTKQAVLVGYHGEKQQAGNSTQEMEKLADYLISTGY